MAQDKGELDKRSGFICWKVKMFPNRLLDDLGRSGSIAVATIRDGERRKALGLFIGFQREMSERATVSYIGACLRIEPLLSLPEHPPKLNRKTLMRFPRLEDPGPLSIHFHAATKSADRRSGCEYLVA